MENIAEVPLNIVNPEFGEWERNKLYKQDNTILWRLLTEEKFLLYMTYITRINWDLMSSDSHKKKESSLSHKERKTVSQFFSYKKNENHHVHLTGERIK